MNKLRLLAITALLAVSALAVTRAAQNSTRDEMPFFYTGPTSGPDLQDQLNDPSNYTSTDQGFHCNGTNIVCSITDNASSSDPTEPALDKGQVTNTQGGNYSTTQRNL